MLTKSYDLGLPAPAGGLGVDLAAVFDAEKLVRLHPHFFVTPQPGPDGLHCFAVKDYASGEESSLSFGLSLGSGTGLALEFSEGPVAAIRLAPREARIFAQVDYFQPEPEPELENHILLWLRGIREYLGLHLRKNPSTWFFRQLMDRALLRMNPSQRKICQMLWRMTLLELLVIVAIIVGYFWFMR